MRKTLQDRQDNIKLSDSRAILSIIKTEISEERDNLNLLKEEKTSLLKQIEEEKINYNDIISSISKALKEFETETKNKKVEKDFISLKILEDKKKLSELNWDIEEAEKNIKAVNSQIEEVDNVLDNFENVHSIKVSTSEVEREELNKQISHQKELKENLEKQVLVFNDILKQKEEEVLEKQKQIDASFGEIEQLKLEREQEAEKIREIYSSIKDREEKVNRKERNINIVHRRLKKISAKINPNLNIDNLI